MIEESYSGSQMLTRAESQTPSVSSDSTRAGLGTLTYTAYSNYSKSVNVISEEDEHVRVTRTPDSMALPSGYRRTAIKCFMGIFVV